MKVFSLIGLLSILLLLSHTGSAETTSEDFTIQIKQPLTVREKDCPPDKPWLELKEPDTSYYKPELTKLTLLNDFLSPLTITRPEFPYESICEKITDPACDIFKIIQERDKIAEEWNNSDLVKQAQIDIAEAKAKNKEIEDKNNTITEFMNSEIVHQIDRLNHPKTETGQFVTHSDSVFIDSENLLYDNFNPTTPFQKKALYYFKHSLENFYALKDTQFPEKYEKNSISYNQKKKERNKTIEQKNQEIEKQNAEILKKFHEFYTPEKLQQLLNDYDMLLNKNCVSKTIDKDLYMTREDCESAEEDRDFIKDEENHSRYGVCKLKKFLRLY